jgi:2-succinyl-5-enolpyruvyl-6-hydroxy-3-cyclohexene-1-carboxylate synthase
MSGSRPTSPRRGRDIIAALVAAGVRDFVLAPGSRSAPLALPLAAGERAGDLGLHVRIDERSAGYTALGIAKATGRPVAVITTSGTAAVNLHPAIVEASYAGVPLLAITADRPPKLRGVGANQTIDQVDVFSAHVRWSADLIAADDDAGTAEINVEIDAEMKTVRAAVAAAVQHEHPGPIHLNIAFDEPLVDPDEVRWQPPAGVAGAPIHGVPSASPEERRFPARGLVVVGDTGGFPEAAAAPTRIAELAAALGWPVISEPSGNATAGTHSLAHGALVLADDEFTHAHPPEMVITIGRVGLHRSIARAVAGTAHHVVIDPRPVGFISDPQRTAIEVLPVIPTLIACDVDPQWLPTWRRKDAEIAGRVTSRVAEIAPTQFTGVQVAMEVAQSLLPDDLFVVGASWPVRHVSMFAGPLQARCLSNRGTSGIDGVISTAWGAATTHPGHTVALLGDLTALYDRNGLIAGPAEPRPKLTYVVIDNDGGGIFSQLEQGAPAFAADFERVFGTPHGVDLAPALAAPGVSVTSVDDLAGLRRAMAAARAGMGDGVHVIIARCANRATEMSLVRRLSSQT